MVIQDNTSQPSDIRKNTMCDVDFWYSRNAVLSLLTSLFLIVLCISYLIPPFQSPDEFNHLKRAYLLSKGDVFLHNKGQVAGGYIDNGLLNYMTLFDEIPFKYDKKLYNQGYSSSRQITWSGKKQFSPLPNTALYFPLPYAPQALAFIVGEHSSMTVSNTYYLARFFSLTATLALLGCALLLYPAPLILITAFITPMSLFQLGSASLDSISFAMCVLAASLYMRGGDNRYSFNQPMLYALTTCVFTLATSRLYLFPLTLLPSLLYINRRSYSYLLPSAILFAAALAWIGYSITTFRDISRGTSTMGIVFSNLQHPLNCFKVLYTTLSSNSVLTSYWHMFVGVLGWLDTPLRSDVYVSFGVLLFIFAVISFQRNIICLHNWRHIFLLLAALSSAFLLFFMLLASWTTHLSYVVRGIQGRYFTPIAILLSYAIFDRRLSKIEFRLGLIIIFLMICFSIASMSPKLLDRYWLSSEVETPSNLLADFSADAYNNRGVSIYKLGHYKQAISDFDRAIEINPKYAEAYYNRGIAYGKLDNYGHATSDFDMAIEINGKYAEAYNGRGFAYGKLGNHRQAISDFDRAIEINPNYAMAYYNRAVVYGILGNHSQEIEDLKTAGRLDRDDAKK